MTIRRLVVTVVASLAVHAAVAARVSAQEHRIVTLVPSYTETWDAARQASGNPATLMVRDTFSTYATPVYSYLYFPAQALPPGATIERLQLRLVQMGTQPNPNNLLVDVVPVECVGNPCRPRSYAPLDQVAANFTSAPGLVDVVEWAPGPAGAGRSYIALVLKPEGGRSGRTYVSPAADDVEGAAKRPRLIVTYSIASTAPALARVQADGYPDVRSARPFVPAAGAPLAYAARDVAGRTTADPRNVTRTPASFNGLAYLVQSRGPNDRSLDAIGPLGGVVWSVALPTDPGPEGVFVVANGSGRLAVVGKSRILVYQLNAADRAQPPTPLFDAQPGVLRNPAAVMPGPDGSLYVADDRNLYALNPALQLLWWRDIGSTAKRRDTALGPIARMTLSPDGRFVYAAGIWSQEGAAPRKARLMAINAQTGGTVQFDLPPVTEWIHAPVVVRHPDGPDYVFVGANSNDTGVLRCVTNSPDTPRNKSGDVVGDTGARLTACKGAGWEHLAGRMGQPILDSSLPPAKGDLSTKRLFVVREPPGGRPVLTEINAQTGAMVGTSPDLPGTFRDLWDGGNPVMDSTGTPLFWENRRLYGFPAAGGGSRTVFAVELSSLPADTQLVFGPGGTLYANTVADSALRALVPRYCVSPAPGDPCGDARVQGVSEISSPTHLQIDGIAGEQTSWVLSADGDVILGAGFAVKQGATVSVRSSGR